MSMDLRVEGSSAVNPAVRFPEPINYTHSNLFHLHLDFIRLNTKGFLSGGPEQRVYP